MKKLIVILAGLLVAGCAFAGPDMVQITGATIQTNGATATQQTPENDVFLWGWLDTVIVDLLTAGASTTNTITISTQASKGTGASRTLLTITGLTADGSYPVRDLVTGVDGADIANTPARMPLVQDKLQVTITQGGGTNDIASGMTIYFVISPIP